MQKEKVLVAMSGGTDSSAVCIMLQEMGYEVVGMTMRVWDLPRQFKEGKEEPDFILQARHLAERLGIEHHTTDVRAEFRETVVEYFLNEYTQGRTPNPCVLCNLRFKFRLLTELADTLGCQYIATGHYVRTREHNGNEYLLMGDDIKKDQSYFLWRLPQSTLKRCIFPLGKMTKPEVRQYLHEKGFPANAQQKESMEVCFVENDYRDFLKQQRPELEQEVNGGCYVDAAGRKLGIHQGVPFYTVGQRKGLGIALGYPAYVLRLNAIKNTIVLGKEEDLKAQALLCDTYQFVCPKDMNDPNLSVRIRYHSRPVPCRIRPLENNLLLVTTTHEVQAVTPGQSAVFYIGDRLVGGAVITSQKGIGGILAASKE